MLPESVQHLEGFFALRIDTTDYGTILRYLDAQTSDIKQIVLVTEELKIEHVAATMCGLTQDPECQQLVGHWFATGAILTLGQGEGQAEFERNQFSPDNRFRCLYVPPQYLIQLAD